MGGGNGSKQVFTNFGSRLPLSKFKIFKTMIVDGSSLLYRVMHNSSNNWLSLFHNFCNKFDHSKLIFIFDGRPPPDKSRCIEKRKTNSTKKTLANPTTFKEVKITLNDITQCKKLLDSLGIKYIHIDTLEADAIIKYLSKSGIVDVVFSQDSDMFRIGCKNVCLDIDYKNNTILCIDFDVCLKELGITQEQFNEAYDAAGTDYNDNLTYCKFSETLELIKKYNNIENILENLDEINSGKISRIIKEPKNFNFIRTREIFDRNISESDIKSIARQLNNC